MSSTPAPSSSSSAGFGEFFRYHGWLSPGVRLFRTLSFTAKAMWISAAFLLPLLIMLWLVWSGAQATIDSSRHEEQGLRYLKPVYGFMEAAQNRRRAAATGAADLPEAQAKVDAAWAQVEAVHKQEGAGLGVDKAFAAVQQAQAALKQNPVAGDADATFEAHSRFLAQVLALVTDVADGSELALDPELDTYHMMLLSVQRGPLLIEKLAQLSGLGTTVLKSGEMTPARQRHLAEYLAVLPMLEADVQRSHKQGVDGFSGVAERLNRREFNASQTAFLDAANTQLMGEALHGNADDFLKLANAAVDSAHDYNQRVFDRLLERLEQRVDEQHAAQVTRLSVAAGFVLLALYLMVAFYKVMMGGLQEVAGHLREITQGNLTTAPRPWGSDEAAQLMLTLGEMQAALRRIVASVLDGSAQVRNSSGEIAGAAHDLSGRTEQAAANLQQTAATMEQMAGQVQQSGSTVQGAARIVQDNAGAASSCGRVIGDVVQTMDGIRTSSNRIGEIIGTIDGIAFQTNILALNAAVEAARAGEHGRGFAVVASEVRALAQRSAQAAKEIKTLISTSIEQVESGHGVVVKAREMMATIVSNAEHMATMMSEITATTQQQGQGVVEVGQAVRSLDESTQQNAALVEQTSAAASALADQAERLSAEIGFFKLA